jgi:S-adenosyl-L-methionine hydrolase (adenosine-forming)
MEQGSSESAPFCASGVITLTTDFGLSEPYVGIMKGVILARCPTARLIDLTHQVPPFQPGLAGFWLARSWQHFAVGTLHLAVVDPGVGTDREMVLLEAGGQVFVAPDNGLLDPVFRSAADSRWRTFGVADVSHLLPTKISHTFHGRDVFAPVAAEIGAGRLQVGDLGQARAAIPFAAPRRGREGQIVGADHFGNLVTDIPAEGLDGLIAPIVLFRGQRIAVCRSYGFAPAGELLGLVNSWGTLEIAVAQGNAQQALQATPGEGVAVIESMPSG